MLDATLEAALPLVSSHGDGMAAVVFELEVRPWIALASQNVFGLKSKFAPAIIAPAVAATSTSSGSQSAELAGPRGDSKAVSPTAGTYSQSTDGHAFFEATAAALSNGAS